MDGGGGSSGNAPDYRSRNHEIEPPMGAVFSPSIFK